MNRAAVRPAVAGVTEAAPAKINLALHVTGRRADGYHLLDTLAVFAAPGDRVTVAPAAHDSFAATGPFAGAVPADAGNLVLQARDAFFGRIGRASSVAITLEKNLPVASGLGGGSADAAATLRALARLFWPGFSMDELAAAGLSLGADVPMCLVSQPLIAKGIGERIAPLDAFPALAMVLVNPGTPVSTPAAFAMLDQRDNPPLPPLAKLSAFEDVLSWLRATRNDLEAPARRLAPPISAALDALRSAGAPFARMSGSGATCFGLFETPDHGQWATALLRAAQPAWWVVAAASSPAAEAAP